MKNSEKKVTIKDVAQLAGVSKGTVDRVIHNRGEVSAESLKRVLDVIDRIGYKPNVYASLLASRKHYRIVCLIPDFESGEFWEIAYKGILKAYEECQDFNVTVDVVRYDQFRVDSFQQACRNTIQEAPDAVLIVPMFSDSAAQFVNELHAMGYTVFAIEQCEGSTMLDKLTLEPDKKYAVVLGNEVKGVKQEVVNRCDGCIEIPQFGTKHSLNVSVTAGIIIWEFACKLI